MAIRTCIVTVTDLRGIRQSVEVTAEKVCLKQPPVRCPHSDEMPGSDGIGPATRLEIQVPQPAITHTVTVQQLERWANGSLRLRDTRN